MAVQREIHGTGLREPWGTGGSGQLQELGPTGLRDGPSVGVRNQGGKVGVRWDGESWRPLWGGHSGEGIQRRAINIRCAKLCLGRIALGRHFTKRTEEDEGHQEKVVS